MGKKKISRGLLKAAIIGLGKASFGELNNDILDGNSNLDSNSHLGGLTSNKNIEIVCGYDNKAERKVLFESLTGPLFLLN